MNQYFLTCLYFNDGKNFKLNKIFFKCLDYKTGQRKYADGNGLSKMYY